MVRETVSGDPVGMAVTRERSAPWPAAPHGAAPPAVVCVLNGSPPGRAAAAYAAALSRALQWRLGLVASGLRPLEAEMLAAAVAGEDPGLVVIPVESCRQPADAVELANRAHVPVVVVPSRWRTQTTGDADVIVLARDAMPELAGIATRVALAWGARLRLMRDPATIELGIRTHSRLKVASVDDAPVLAASWGVEPVMLVPRSAGSQRLAA